MITLTLSRRDLALLRAVRAGHAELICGKSMHLLVDGLNVCDSDAAPLILGGLIAPSIPGTAGMQVLARITDAGMQALAVSP